VTVSLSFAFRLLFQLIRRSLPDLVLSFRASSSRLSASCGKRVCGMGTCFGKTGGPEAQLPATQLAQPDSRAPPPAGRLPAVAEPPGSTAPRNGGPADSVAELRSAQQPTSPSTTITERILPVLYNHLQNSIHALDLAASSVAESMSDVPPELREDLSDIVTATRNTHILVNDLLTISRLKQGTLAPMPEVVCIRQKLKDAASRARSAVRVPISVSCSPDVPSLLCVDAALLSHILADALTLSARYCDTGGSIHVLMYRASSSASASAASVGATGGAAATPMLGTAAAAGGPVDRRLVVEVMDTGAGLGGVSGADMLRALRGGQQVKGARAQRMSVFLALAHVLAETMGGETDVVEWRDASARVVRFSMTCPFTLPSEAERARATEELLDVLAEEGADMTPLPLPQPFAAASGFAAGGAGSVPAPAAPLAGAKETGAAVPARQPSTQGGAAGAGTAATVEALPPMPATAAGAETVASGGAGARRGGRRAVVGLDGQPLSMHVLLVDDMGVIRRQGEAFLEQLGCTCITLEDGDEVESALRNARRPFDAIVLDIVMSRSDGAQVCRNLREAFNVRCPIIAMTGQTSSKDLQRYYAMGFDVVLPKPFTRDAIGRALVEGRERCVIFEWLLHFLHLRNPTTTPPLLARVDALGSSHISFCPTTPL